MKWPAPFRMCRPVQPFWIVNGAAARKKWFGFRRNWWISARVAWHLSCRLPAHRAELLIAAFQTMACEPPQVDTGDVRDDLVQLMSGLAEQLRTERWASALPSLAAEARHEPHLATLHAAFLEERREHVHAVIRRGIERGELPPGTDVGLLTMMVAGPIFFRALVSLEPLDEPGLPERVVDAALYGMRGSRTPG